MYEPIRSPMIKFFRHIRQAMIKENRASKYMLYAFGEIVLVVVGILIALQINNWNEHRKTNASWQYYTESLIKDLEQDTTTLNMITRYIENDSNHLKKLTERLSAPNATFDTLIRIVRQDLVLEYKTYRPPNNKTFLAMQANGTIELFDEKTYSSLLDLQTNQSIAASIIHANNSNYLAQFTSLTSKYSVVGMNVIQGPLAEKAWQDVDADDLFRAVEGLMGAKKMMNQYTGIRYSELLILTEQVLSRLNEVNDNQVDQ